MWPAGRPRSRSRSEGRAAVACVLVAASCVACGEPEAPPPSDPALRAELGIPSETPIHRVDLGGPSVATRVAPRLLQIRSGDVVQFVVLDHRVHRVRFVEDDLGQGQIAFLRGTSQDSPPPLVEQGARLVLSFEGAPGGSYPFVVEGFGTPVRGEIRVAGP